MNVNGIVLISKDKNINLIEYVMIQSFDLENRFPTMHSINHTSHLKYWGAGCVH